MTPRLSALPLPLVAVLVAAALSMPVASQASQTPAERCEQLIAYFDRYSPARGEHSDGFRNMTRISASIDCDRGDWAKGIAVMEALLVRKKFTVPPPP